MKAPLDPYYVLLKKANLDYSSSVTKLPKLWSGLLMMVCDRYNYFVILAPFYDVLSIQVCTRKC
jgi:hypothetical protein